MTDMHRTVGRCLRAMLACLAGAAGAPNAAHAAGSAGPAASAGAASATAAPALRVCADPDNMPFSNRRDQGFENRIAELIAHSLGRPLAYRWHPQDAHFLSRTLDAHLCDVVMAMPSPASGLDTTRPYYWSSYVWVSRTARRLDIVSLGDHRLRHMRIGVQAVMGEDLYSPPARVLADSGLAAHIVPYAARAQLLHAVATGQVDLAAAWGPAVGYEVQRSRTPLTLRAISDLSDFSSRESHFTLQGIQYQISMAVRPADDALRAALDAAIARNRARIEAILDEFGVPLVDPARLDTTSIARSDVHGADTVAGHGAGAGENAP